MSELRKIKLQMDINIVKKVVERLGAELKEKAVPKSYATRNMMCDYVVCYSGIEFGIVGRELVYDDMFGSKVAKFMSVYLEEILKSRNVRFRKVETEREYVFIIS